MTTTLTPTLNNVIGSAAMGMGIRSSRGPMGKRPAPYTLGFAMAMSHMGYTVTKSNGYMLIAQADTFGKRTHVYQMYSNGSVWDITAVDTRTLVTGKRALAITLYVQAAEALEGLLVVVPDYQLVKRAFVQVVRHPHNHL